MTKSYTDFNGKAWRPVKTAVGVCCGLVNSLRPGLTIVRQNKVTFALDSRRF
jgi:hypothetical protein